MDSRLRQSLIPVVALLAVLATACSNSDKTLFIEFAVALDDKCEASIQTSEPYEHLNYGTLDLGQPYFNNEPVYYLYPQIHNYVVSDLNNRDHRLVASYHWRQAQARRMPLPLSAGSRSLPSAPTAVI